MGYTCKMQTPPSPQETKVRAGAARRPLTELMMKYFQMEGGAAHPGQYPGYSSCGQSWNNDLPAGHVQSGYSLPPHGQPSPLPPGGPQGGPGSAPVPSPLYPWMRSQFGKLFLSQLILRLTLCILS